MDKSALLNQLSKFEALRSSLHSSLRFWEWMVVVGLIVDLFVILKEYWDDLKDFWRHEIHPPERPSTLLLLLGLLGTGLIAFGISRELSFDSKIEGAETQIRRFNDELFGLVSTEAQDASDKAAAAGVAAVEAKGEADAVKAEAKKIDERLRAASQLLDMLGPRWKLLEHHKAAFIKALRPFARQRIIVVSCGISGPDATEPNKLRDDLIDFLGHDGAGWAVESKDATWDDCAIATVNVPPVVGGIVLVVSTTADVAAKHSATVSAKKLEDTLNEVRITTRTATDTRVDTASVLAEPNSFWKLVDNDPKAVFLLVGNNPLFTLTKRRTE